MILQRLVHDHGLLILENTKEGTFLIPDLKRFETTNELAAICRWPRNCVVLFVALVWIVSPIDIIPDFMPLGVVDDAVIAYLGFSPFAQQIISSFRRRERGPELGGIS